MDSSQKAKLIAKLAQDKKAHDILIMDMRKVFDLTDYFIILSADSSRQIKTIADHILESMKKNGFYVWHTEGYQDSRWVLLDYGDAIVHLFIEEARRFYELERLWRDVPIEKVSNSEN